jgi:hypothetical protein
MRTREGIFPNPNCETKQTRTRTQHMQNKNPMKFYCKEKIKIEQGYDKKNIPKIGVEHIKSNGEFYF